MRTTDYLPDVAFTVKAKVSAPADWSALLSGAYPLFTQVSPFVSAYRRTAQVGNDDGTQGELEEDSSESAAKRIMVCLPGIGTLEAPQAALFHLISSTIHYVCPRQQVPSQSKDHRRELSFPRLSDMR